MDCNREEAIRAKGIAEKKMESKDFAGARKFGVKAQQLYPDLENISQMLMVCEVHCSAEQKLFGGNEKDWYGILQIDQKADEQTIKRQFKKFALQLHPDKNKFSGAEAAFQLISEAQNVLLDRDKRSLHDIKRRACVSKTNVPYQPPAKASYFHTVRTNIPGMNPPNRQQQHPTFWTMCPFCNVKYQYYRVSALHKPLTCQSCKKLFVAYETNVQAPPTTVNQQAYPQQKCGFSKVEIKCQGNFTADKPKSEPFQKSGLQAGGSSGIGSEKVNRKRDKKRDRKRVVASESSDSESSTDSEDVDMEGVHQRFYGEQPRRSSRSKQQVSYKENLSDDDDIPLSKRGKRSGSSCATEEQNEYASKEEESKMNSQSEPVANTKGDEEKVKQKESASVKNSSKVQAKKMVNDERSSETKEKVHENPTSDTSSHEKIAEPLYSVPLSDFSDFENIRTEECFKVGQLWAVYDNQNGMPRFYARIKKLHSPVFKVHITWLEADPDDDNGKKWLNANLPISCGKFTQGQSETIEGIGIFSHVICWEKIKNTYKIYPRKGETWAIFKNWEMNWCSDLDSNCKRKFEYEYVEILSEYDEGVGLHVALLEKVEGFVSVFCQTVQEGKGTFHVLPGELLRFSHRLPSFKLTGDEGAGVPSGSVELDPASMLFSAEEIEAREKKSRTNGLFSKSSDMRESMTGNVATQGGDPNIINLEPEQNKPSQDHDAHEASDIEVPEPVFYNFDADKSLEKFEIGQIWALYSDEDGLPKYYGQIKKIDSRRSKLKIMVAWLESSSLPGDAVEWCDQDMPISCGRFEIRKNYFQDYDSTQSFSHLVKAVLVSRTEVDILPKMGEVWAVYKNWTPDISISGLATCDYDIVEVCEVNDLQRKVLILGRVDGFNSVFKVEVKGGLAETMTIPEGELLRFSHSIPSFRLTEEKGGSLRGCWELDPAAFPVRYFSQN
ncbi:PREDICTED: uncharacterized protein LOC101301565 [Fragaria vesca subsp. vesca]|uniref:uncharacterized protein LOC101301565 n=1 Tax=Fragaria vesca subsp. vesca TaxID=101020 RepID=UPI0002C32DEB|nr:PREDICTED: uncharacterized protein LOC101301565 [Fragaria vesca subsp. vesca]